MPMKTPRPAAHGTRVQPALLVVFVVALSAFSLWLFLQRNWWLPELASVHGADFDTEFAMTLAITGFMFVAVQLALGYLAFRFSANRGEARYRVPSRRFEMRFAVLVAVIVFIVDISLFVTAEASFRRLADASDENAVQVEVVAEQFAWNIRYPGPDGEFGRTDPTLIDVDSNPLGLDPADPFGTDDIVRLNDMHLPVDRLMTVRIRFEPNLEGRFEIMCAQLCGLAHYTMRGFLTVESDEEFEQWLQEEF
jgi:cytochrome c oxidase subunit 2